MGLRLQQNRDGTLRPNWHGAYGVGGRTTVVNLGVPIRGTPPESKRVSDRGDREFERSRQDATMKLAVYQSEAKGMRTTKAEGIRHYRATTGYKLEKTPIGSLAKIFSGESPSLMRWKTWHPRLRTPQRGGDVLHRAPLA